MTDFNKTINESWGKLIVKVFDYYYFFFKDHKIYMSCCTGRWKGGKLAASKNFCCLL